MNRTKRQISVQFAKEYWYARAEVMTMIRTERDDGTYQWSLHYGGVDSLTTHRDIEALEIEGPWHNASALAKDIYGAMREIESMLY